VQSHRGGVDLRERAIDGVDHQLHPREEMGERPIREECVTFHRQVWRVDLQQQALVDDEPILDAEGTGDGAHVLLL
jgi:hypothetical protein